MRTLSDGRIRRSEAEWREIFARYEKSGLSELAFCRRSKIARKTFRAWRRRLAAPPRRPAKPRAAFVEWAPPFVPRAAEGSSQAGSAFELELPGGVVLRWKA